MLASKPMRANPLDADGQGGHLSVRYGITLSTREQVLSGVCYNAHMATRTVSDQATFAVSIGRLAGRNGPYHLAEIDAAGLLRPICGKNGEQIREIGFSYPTTKDVALTEFRSIGKVLRCVICERENT